MFKIKVDLIPFPIDAEQAVEHSRALDALINASDLATARQTAMSDILAADNSEDPSETERLRALYRLAYTSVELETLIHRTFARLGFTE